MFYLVILMVKQRFILINESATINMLLLCVLTWDEIHFNIFSTFYFNNKHY